jgi:Contractile injection system tube protein/LysM domain
MALQKLQIIPEGPLEPFFVMFNPERYTLNKAVQFAEIGIPGLDSPILQFVRGQNEKITMELFFDTTKDGMGEDATDVRKETKKIYQLLKILPETHAPPRCELRWPDKMFSYGSALEAPRCVLESVSEEFELFSPSGVPLRAKLNVSFREYKTIEDQLKETPRRSGDRTKVRTLKPRQTLSDLAWQEYGDATEWRRIAEENNIENPRFVEPGTQLTVPRLTPENV